LGQNFGYVVTKKIAFFFASVNLNKFPKKKKERKNHTNFEIKK
jgi:hypothetical protein